MVVAGIELVGMAARGSSKGQVWRSGSIKNEPNPAVRFRIVVRPVRFGVVKRDKLVACVRHDTEPFPHVPHKFPSIMSTGTRTR